LPPSNALAVLFVCTFNRVRSPMAAGLVRLLYGEALEADSCGLQAGEEIDPLAAAVMAEVGVDLASHRPRRLEDMIGERRYDHIVALSGEAWPQVKALAQPMASNWPIPDPAERESSRHGRLEAYRITRQMLQVRILECFGPRRAAL